MCYFPVFISCSHFNLPGANAPPGARAKIVVKVYFSNYCGRTLGSVGAWQVNFLKIVFQGFYI